MWSSFLAKGKNTVCLDASKAVDMMFEYMTWGNTAYCIDIILNTQPMKTRLKNKSGLRKSLQLYNYAKTWGKWNVSNLEEIYPL